MENQDCGINNDTYSGHNDFILGEYFFYYITKFIYVKEITNRRWVSIYS